MWYNGGGKVRETLTNPTKTLLNPGMALERNLPGQLRPPDRCFDAVPGLYGRPVAAATQSAFEVQAGARSMVRDRVPPRQAPFLCSLFAVRHPKPLSQEIGSCECSIAQGATRGARRLSTIVILSSSMNHQPHPMWNDPRPVIARSVSDSLSRVFRGKAIPNYPVETASAQTTGHALTRLMSLVAKRSIL
jgi:hypothetical protein